MITPGRVALLTEPDLEADLVVADALHAHSADAVVLEALGDLVAADALHAHSAAALTLTQVHNLVVADALHGHSAAQVTLAGSTLVSISGRKLVRGTTPFLVKCASSWGMGQRLTNAEITTYLEAIVELGYNSFTFAPNGLEFGDGDGWDRWTNIAGNQYFATVAGGNTAGTPISSPLGAAWSTVDWILDEAARLDMIAMLAFYGGYSGEGIAGALIAAGTTGCYNYGVRVATRYADYSNLVWEYVADWDYDYGSRDSEEIDALFHGIVDTEGGDRLIFCEPKRPRTSYDQFISQEGTSGTGYEWLHVDLNSLYAHTGIGTDEIDGVYNEAGATDLPVWNCEPAYIESNHYAGDDQELREAFYSTFIRGGIGLNVGSEEIYSFNASGVQIDEPDWETGLTNVELLRTAHLWALVDRYVADLTWVPSAWVTTGIGTGDTKAAAGNSDTAALCYFPTSRAITVDTTVLSGSSDVRLRWFDPTDGTYTLIATSEAQNASRSVTHPGANSAGVGDWVLVVDFLPAVKFGASTLSASKLGSTSVAAMYLGDELVWTEPSITGLVVADASHAHSVDNVVLDAPGEVENPVAVLGTPVAVTGSTSPRTLSVTVPAGTNRVMFAAMCVDSGTPGTYTHSITSDLDGALTLVTNLAPASTNNGIAVYYKLNPTVGTHSLSIAHSIGTNTGGMAICFEHVDQTTPYTGLQTYTGGSSTSTSLTVTTSTGGLVVDFAFLNNSPIATVGADQTEHINLTWGGAKAMLSTQAPAAGGVMTWTWTGAQRAGAIGFCVEAA